jgi:uncharacterized protein YbjT (DUF2867 family)
MATPSEGENTIVLVTGATGTVGSEVVSQLYDESIRLRIATRDPSQIEISGTSSKLVKFDFEHPETWGATLTEVDRLFLVRPPNVGISRLREFVDAAERVGVQHIVYLSVLSAEKNPLLPHYRMERYLEKVNVTYTFLRAANFMQNFSEIHRHDIVEYGEIFVPAGDGKTGFVDARDVAAVGVAALTEPGHENCAYDVTGPVALDCDEVADAFTDVLGRRITYPNPSILTFARRMRSRNVPYPMIGVMILLYTVTRLGLSGRLSSDVERVLGNKPRGIQPFVKDYADAFQ